ncbi:MAG TPA: hypothetical protein VJR02_14520 [Pyrinomonadaceae bacterium]|nr:hypothetical protein [Pyrinomonadaceae bacterium]
MLVLLIILIFIYHVGAAIYSGLGLEPLPAFDFLYEVAFVTGVVWWLRAEAKRSAVTSVYCQGMLVAAGWFIIIPYHLFKTRGVRGLVPLFALIGSIVLAWIVGESIAFAFRM